MESLLKFFGVWAQGADTLVGVRGAYHATIHPAILVLSVALILALVVWLYRKEEGDFTGIRRAVMAACRVAFLVLLLGILLRPVLAVTVASSVRETMIVLVDSSASMQIADVREQDADRVRAGIAQGRLDVRRGFNQSVPAAQAEPPKRIDLVKGVLASSDMDLLHRIGKEFNLAVFAFDRDLKELATETPSAAAPWIDNLKAEGEATALGDAIRNAIAAKRGQAVGGIWLISDGASNTGSSPATAAQVLRDEHLPVYAYGVGIASPKDIVVSTVLGPEVAFVNDELPVTVRIHAQGLQGQRGVLTLKLDGSRVDDKEVSFDKEGEQIIPMKFTPTKVGDFTLEASIPPRPEEIVKDNNTSSPKHLRVVDGKIKVLQIEQTPRWEFKYLQALLMRDRRVEYRCWLLEADPEVEHAGGPSPYLAGFPARKEDLLRYDLIILGDVDPRKLPAGAMDQLVSFVSNFGGGLIMVAGQRAAPQNYRRTPIEPMLPVELDVSTAPGLYSHSDLPIHLELTPVGKASPTLRLAEKDADSLRLWEQLPPVYWTARVSRAKPAAEVLLVDTDPSKASRFGKMPVIALQQYGLGQVLFVGTDNTWRWRRNQGEETFNRVWSQIVERMALAHMLGLAKRTQLSMDKEKYATSDRVTAYARLYREKDFEPISDPTVKGYYALKGAGNAPHEVLLRAVPDQPGMYRGEFVAPAAGTYQFKSETDSQTFIDFMVAASKLELVETAMNEAGLRELAQSSGGAFVREEDLYRLPDQMRHTAQPVQSTYEVEIWSSPAYFLVILTVVGVEWFLRKRAQLK